MTAPRWVRGALAAGLLWATPAASAEGKPPASPEDLDKDVLTIPYRDGQDFKGGRLVYVNGTSDASRDVRFGLERLSISQPLSVSVMTKNPGARLRLTAAKWGGTGGSKKVETDKRGAASLAFRVQGDAQLIVRGLGAQTPFQLMVWVGPELKRPLKSPFSAAKAEALRSGKGVKGGGR